MHGPPASAAITRTGVVVAGGRTLFVQQSSRESFVSTSRENHGLCRVFGWLVSEMVYLWNKSGMIALRRALWESGCHGQEARQGSCFPNYFFAHDGGNPFA